ncbi:MAG TPA: YraN family protein [Bryobacteraceae bacterium]|jgi:putative endonuclease|nr:YraN family protein [Bryobacteraceae bacterium]
MMGQLYRAADALRRRRIAEDHGRVGEDIAHRYLRRHGCTIVARRYRPNSGGGEIDIVAWHRGTLVFVEVKARASAEFGTPDRAVDGEKQRYLAHAGRDYARRAGVEWTQVRFDIVGIILSKPPQIEWLQDAFRP